MQEKHYYVYIMANQRDTTLYTGVTSNLSERIWQHKQKLVKGFTAKYNIDKLVYYEVYNNPEDAIAREKQIKAGSRARKIELINKENREWRDLSDDF